MMELTKGVQLESFYYGCINTWNDQPKEDVNPPSIQFFKRRLDQARGNHSLRFGQQFTIFLNIVIRRDLKLV